MCQSICSDIGCLACLTAANDLSFLRSITKLRKVFPKESLGYRESVILFAKGAKVKKVEGEENLYRVTAPFKVWAGYSFEFLFADLYYPNFTVTG